MKHLNQHSGFTLVEVVLVIVIMGILVSTALNSITKVSDTVKVEQTKKEMDILAKSIAGDPDLNNNNVRSDFGYVGDVGALPNSLNNLITNPGGYITWNGPYFTNTFSQITDDYSKDAWGDLYVYSGVNATITSVGSGTNIIRRIAPSAGDLLYNQVSGNIFDLDGTPPGSDYNDSIQVLLTIPDGSGSISILSITPDAGGYFSYDSIPIGNHLLEIIYEPLNDTTRRFVSITPNSEFYTNYNLSGNYWSATGGGGASGIETLRPNGSGAYTDLTSSGCSDNWECVDEASADGLSTNVYETSSSYYSDTYQIENHSTGSGTIDSFVIYISCEETNPSGRVYTRIRTNGNNYDGSQEDPGSSFSIYSTTYTTNPFSSSAWTWTEIDNLEIGVYLRRVRCTQVFVEVYYTN
jgi:prepilin-type N-terminal cleavage/methylation domain-containing protein